MSADPKDGGKDLPARSDTPVDTPAVAVSAASLSPPRSGELEAPHGTLETLEAAYALWGEDRARHAATLAKHADERRRIEDEASFMVGAVKAAQSEAAPAAVAGDALAAPSELSRFVQEAERRIADARAALEARSEAEVRAFDGRFAAHRAAIRERLERFAAARRPPLRVVPRRLAGDRRIVHVDRIGADDSLLLLYVLTGKIASRYGFLHDDATDDVSLPPPALYPDEGVAADRVRADATALEALIRVAPEVLPIKGFLPLSVPVSDGRTAFYRLLQRGPVMELELGEGGQFRNVLTREEAERAAGHLIRLKLAGRLEVALAAE